ncbi:MAG: phytoene/squalene synthase family protein [Actinomycetota bacterium]|nr:phytoene/squalene synthase family protein [Actinomycetota bacterium]MDP2289024.1 phytoene/squalene synthase family protein [Actinomycetota bacterium]
MSGRELDAAGIVDPMLRASYEQCRALNAKYGKTYYLATLLLPPAKRPFVHALYGLARYADEIVDDMSSPLSDAQRQARLEQWAARFFADLDKRSSTEPIISAVIDTAARWQIPRAHFEAFFKSMTMDLTITEYATYEDLHTYVYGSAAVIGLQVVPILEPSHEAAYEYAIDLGIAFQLANFIRDVNEDLDRGRVYLPLNELAQFGVTRADLEQRKATPEIKQALAFQIARVRQLEERSRIGIAMLHPAARPCIDAARELYCGIVDEIERIDYEVFETRARVSMARRLKVAAPAWMAARRARRKFGSGATAVL